MKRALHSLILVSFPILAIAQFNAGESVHILDAQYDDQYMAGGEVTVDAPVYGDVMAAGGQVVFNDSILQDLTVAGGELEINGNIGDDLRVMGGDVTINGTVNDDLLVFGGDVKIGRNAVIRGNLLAYSGQVRMDGSVLGAARLTGGEIDIDGQIMGPTQIVAEDIHIGDSAEFHAEVRYYREGGEVDFGSSMVSGSAILDESLAWKTSNADSDLDPVDDSGISWLGWFMFIVSGLLIIALLNKLFHERFRDASEFAETSVVNSLGYGLIYLILVPIIIVVLLVTVVGIPFAVLMLVIYIITLALGSLISGLTISHILLGRSGTQWGFWKVVLIALLSAIGLKLLGMIPFIGGLITFVVIAIAFGAILLTTKKRTTSSVAV